VIRARIGTVISGRTRDEWAEVFAEGDACVAPVLRVSEAPQHPQATARGAFVEVGGVVQPAPAPRFDRTPADPPLPPPFPGGDGDDVLAGMGFGPDEIARLRDAGAVG
jgi:alpha-methylacyl-CoA racemase